MLVLGRLRLIIASAAVACAAALAGFIGLAGSSKVAIARGRVAAVAPSARSPVLRGIHKIQHVVIIMQENRSFDSYFGTYPHADGIPGLAGNPGKVPCIPDPLHHDCQKPYHDSALVNIGGPHDNSVFATDLDNGKMDGFLVSRENCHNLIDPISCESTEAIDVMGYHNAHEIPNYWKYAKNFVLQDHMFEPVNSWSLPAHLYMVSEWSATCSV